MTRDACELLWASYNYWCHASTNEGGKCFGPSWWSDPKLHHRSPGMFNEILMAQKANKQYDLPGPVTHRIFSGQGRLFGAIADDFADAGVPSDKVTYACHICYRGLRL